MDNPEQNNPNTEEFWKELESKDTEFQEEVLIALEWIVGHRLFGPDKFDRLSQLNSKELYTNLPLDISEDEKLLYEQFVNFLNSTEFEGVTTQEFVEKLKTSWGVEISEEEILMARETANEVIYSRRRE